MTCILSIAVVVNMTRHHVCILNSADWFVGVFVLLAFDCTYYGKTPLSLYYFNLHTVKNTLNSCRDNYFPNYN